ncbi:(2Fe-2S)-binding protein [Roseateles sp.]|uniref:(2Fe-2S)-binding protein n=1 Tax=Roseateles sp. TaxID=1971397 RepID=UPI0025E31CB4|nr:2Fe-2S iron-sulfur cluster-binding protein [Roseateles sp.]MBV8033925.1 2Fe-2S iron-sulfur cluster binding domain-containing protein [Roseateles sp.]
MSDLVPVQFHVNGRPVRADVPADLPLVDFLREELGLAGTRLCCGIGVCKACTVATRRTPTSQAQPLLACSTPVALLQGQSITTVEGTGSMDKPSRVQQAFLDHFAFQCGYCTPGFVMATEMLVERLRAQPVARAQLDAAIEDAVGQHICRCTGYARYHQAISAVVLAEKGLVVA